MNLKHYSNALFVLLCIILLAPSCKNGKGNNGLKNFHYASFKDSMLRTYDTAGTDSTNVFDVPEFIPGVDSIDTLLISIDTMWHREEAMERLDPRVNDTLRENLLMLDSFLANRKTVPESGCQGHECPVYAEIIKPRQMLYLHIGGELVDSFAVSTGKKGYETPAMDLRPRGPLFIKYTSRKFPGGNYKGLGNMPYAVFVKGGYAIHGTTPGNFSKLGRTASHGCIRLHPENAKIFYELVKMAGLQNVWVSITDSQP